MSDPVSTNQNSQFNFDSNRFGKLTQQIPFPHSSDAQISKVYHQNIQTPILKLVIPIKPTLPEKFFSLSAELQEEIIQARNSSSSNEVKLSMMEKVRLLGNISDLELAVLLFGDSNTIRSFQPRRPEGSLF